MWTSSCGHIIYWRDYLCSIVLPLLPCQKSSDYIHAVLDWTRYLFPLVYLSVRSPVPYYLDDYSFRVSLEVRQCLSSNFAGLLPCGCGYSGSPFTSSSNLTPYFYQTSFFFKIFFFFFDVDHFKSLYWIGQILLLFHVLVFCHEACEIFTPWPGFETAPPWMEREAGGGIGMGNTCKSMADSCQCMAKITTKL